MYFKKKILCLMNIIARTYHSQEVMGPVKIEKKKEEVKWQV